MKPHTRVIADAKSWIIENRTIELALTQRGGMMAPVNFYRDTDEPVQPYYISPWQGERLDIDDPVLTTLRGDFFCMPFGAGGPYGNEEHVTHGEPATRDWTLERYEQGDGRTLFEASLATSVRSGNVKKRITLIDGENVVYLSHRVDGFAGETTYGHHPTLAAGEDKGELAITASPFSFGLTDTRGPGYYAGGEYFALPPGERFDNLDRVPTVWKDDPETDCSVFPNRRGFVDIIGLCSREQKGQPAWVAAVNQRHGFLWFALKDPTVLPTTMFWMENYGRHQLPWNGRNCCIGIEDVCGQLANGLSASAGDNRLKQEGISTTVTLNDTEPFEVHHVQGVVRVPDGFERVDTAEFSDDSVTFVSTDGQRVTATVDTAYALRGPKEALGR